MLKAITAQQGRPDVLNVQDASGERLPQTVSAGTLLGDLCRTNMNTKHDTGVPAENSGTPPTSLYVVFTVYFTLFNENGNLPLAVFGRIATCNKSKQHRELQPRLGRAPISVQQTSYHEISMPPEEVRRRRSRRRFRLQLRRRSPRRLRLQLTRRNSPRLRPRHRRCFRRQLHSRRHMRQRRLPYRRLLLRRELRRRSGRRRRQRQRRQRRSRRLILGDGRRRRQHRRRLSAAGGGP